ncbi:MAG TPA: efflux transporter outer membrane subunit [Tepidisphaeraceae bacterium]|nr:efflux transporter outer membrane subunit [Tepidisphaeraceae bacterium]
MVFFFCAGCEVGPNYHAPRNDLPADYSSTGQSAATQPQVDAAEPASLMEWWRGFNDPQLDSLIVRAEQYNLDLKESEQRIVQARAQRNIAIAPLLPSVNGTGSYSRSFTGSSATTTIINSAGKTQTVNLVSPAQDFFQAGFDSSWEIDVFGGIRRSVEAADAGLAAAVEDRRDVLVTLLSDVAMDYLSLRGYQQQILIAEQNLDAQKRTEDVTKRRLIGGVAAGLDVANAEAEVATTAAQIPVLQAQEQQTIYALSVLLGQTPSYLEKELIRARPIPASPPTVPIGLPADLLRRRPDIREAEENLHAATANIGVAVAQLFPQFSLTGAFGTEGERFGLLGNWADRFWSYGPTVTLPIFQGGRLRAQVAVQNSLQQQAVLEYRKTVLTAMQDVQSALVALSTEQTHRQELTEAVTANQRAVLLSNRLYRNGQSDFLNVLDAERSLYASQAALVQSQEAVSADVVALYKALGGGWEDNPGSPDTRPAVEQY